MIRSQRLVVEIVDGECQFCGVLGPLVSRGNRKLCEKCLNNPEEVE